MDALQGGAVLQKTAADPLEQAGPDRAPNGSSRRDRRSESKPGPLPAIGKKGRAPASRKGGEARSRGASPTPASATRAAPPSPIAATGGPGTFNGRPWSAEEDSLLLAAVEEHGKVWAKVEGALEVYGRSMAMCRNRYQRITCPNRGRKKRGPEGAEASLKRNTCLRCGQEKRGHSCPYVEAHPMGAGASGRDSCAADPSDAAAASSSAGPGSRKRSPLADGGGPSRPPKRHQQLSSGRSGGGSAAAEAGRELGASGLPESPPIVLPAHSLLSPLSPTSFAIAPSLLDKLQGGRQ